MFSTKMLLILGIFMIPAVVMGSTCITSGECLPPSCFCVSGTPYFTNLTISQIPQFVLLTLDDSLTPDFNSLLTTLKQVKNYKNNMNSNRSLPFTLYSIFDYTQFDYMQKFYSWGHEIAVHTMNHNTGSSTTFDTWLSQIGNAVNTFNLMAGIPKSDLVGFRAPFLAYNSEMFEALYQLGFLYDSSITEQQRVTGPSFNTSSFIWPYTFDTINAQGTYATGIPPAKSLPGFFEVPMWMLYDQNGGMLQTMDYQAPLSVYQNLINIRLNSNRAPIGLFNHIVYYLSSSEIQVFYQFVEWCLTKPEIFFVTNRQLIEWMKNPVPYTQLANQAYMQWTDLPLPATVNSCFGFNTYKPCPASDPNLNTVQQTVPINVINHPIANDSTNCNTYQKCNFSNGGNLNDGELCVLNNELWQAEWWINTLPPGSGWIDLGTCIKFDYGGKVSFGLPQYHAIKGSSVTFQITPFSGNTVDKVMVNSVNQGAITSYTFSNIQNSQNFEIYFKQGVAISQNYTITVSSSYGCLSLDEGPNTVSQGQNESYTFQPTNSSCFITNLMIDNQLNPAANSYTFINVQQNHTILPVCFCNYTLTVVNSPGCTISPSTTIVTQNQLKTFTIQPQNAFCTILDVIVDLDFVQGAVTSFTFTNIQESHSIQALCSCTAPPTTHTVTSSTTGCAISPLGIQTVNEGSNITYSINAPTDCQIQSLQLNGQQQDINATTELYSKSFLIANITSDQSLNAVCACPNIYYVTTSTTNCQMTPLGVNNVAMGGNLTILVSASANCYINSLLVDGTSQNISNSQTLTHILSNINSNSTVASSCLCPQFTVQASTTGCNMSPLGSQTVNYDSSVSYAITSPSGCNLTSITLNNINQALVSPFTISNIKTNQNLASTCTCPVIYQINSSTSGCTMSPLGSVNVTQGGNQSYSISTSSGCSITSLQLNGAAQTISNTSAMTFLVSNVNSNQVLTSTCTCLVNYKINATTTNCTMSPLGNVNVTQSGNQSFSISAAPGCAIKSLKLNNINQTITNQQAMTFIVSNVNSNQTLKSTCNCSTSPQYAVTSSTTNCNMSPLGVTNVTAGNSLNFSISASTGCSISSLLLNGVSQSISNNQSLTYILSNILAAQTLASTCTCPITPTTYSVTSSTTNCTMSPLGVINVLSGGNLTFSVSASIGCTISQLLVNSVSKSISNNSSLIYILSNISSDSTVTSTCTCPVQTNNTNTTSPNGTCATYPVWTAGQQYNGGTTVYYTGTGYSYINLWWAQGQEPTQNSVWKLTSFCGNDPACAPAWVSGAIYLQGDLVQYNNIKYQAQWWNQETTLTPNQNSAFVSQGSC